MRRRPGAVVRLVAAIAAMLPGVARSATCPMGLCAPTANPCRVEQSCELERAATIDLGGRDLVIAAGVIVTAVESPLAIKAGSLALEPGAVLTAPDHKARGGGTITITVDDAIRVGSDARIDVAGEFFGGTMALEAGSDVLIDGVLDAGATRFGRSGPIIVTTNTGSIVVGASARVVARSGGPGDGGPVTLTALLGRLAIDGSIDVQGGFFGGSILARTGGDITVSAGARLTLDGTSGRGFLSEMPFSSGIGGDVTFDSQQGDVTVEAPITSTGVGEGEDAGWGGNLDVLAHAGNVVLGGPIDLSGLGPGSGAYGGDMSVLAGGRITQGGRIRAAAQGEFSTGGRVFFQAGDTITLGVVDVTSDEFGGSFDATSSTAIVLVGAAWINADCPGLGGDVSLSAPVVTVEGTITARAPYRSDGAGGTVELVGCDVHLLTRAHISVSARAGGGAVLINAAGSLTLGGRVRAGGEFGFTVIAHGFLPAPVVTRFRPAPMVVYVPGPGLCALPTTTTTTTTITTTTTSATVTSSSSTTTTSTTTVPAPTIVTTTTTTAAPTTTPAHQVPATLPACTPNIPSGCDDGDACTVDRCTDGSCAHDPVGDFDQVVCRLEAVRALLADADGTTARDARSQARLARRLVRVATLVKTAEKASGRRMSSTLGRAARALRAFLHAVERSHALDLPRRQHVMRAAGDALRRLPALARGAISARRPS